MDLEKRKILSLKVRLPNLESLKILSKRLTPLSRTSFIGKYGDILDLLFVNVQADAIRTLAQFYDPPTRSFLFKDFQLAPTLEEFRGIMGIPSKDKGPYVEIGSTPRVEELAGALGIDASELDDNMKERRDKNKGFLSAYLERKAHEFATHEDKKPFINILALLNIYSFVRDIGTENNPYMGVMYASFQERATFVSHSNMARLAKEMGDPVLARICGTIGADEKRHEIAYERITEKLLEVDPIETMLAIAKIMSGNITMPGYLMHDGRDPDLFNHFSVVAQLIGVYKVSDYIDSFEFSIGRWRLEKLEGLTSEGKHAQELVCGLVPKVRRLQERADERVRKMKPKFSWIFQ